MLNLQHSPTTTQHRPDPAAGPEWQPAETGAWLLEPHGRSQPPLREVLKGLDLRELEGEAVFDQLFGPATDA